MIDLCYYIHDYPNETEAKYISAAQEFITGKNSVMTEIEKKEWTAEKLYAAAKEKLALQAYIDYQTGLKKAEDKTAYEAANKGDKKAQALRAEGEKIYASTLAKEDWKGKLKLVNDCAQDLSCLGKNLATITQDLSQKIALKTQDIGKLAEDPAMQSFIAKTAPLAAKKVFAGDAQKKEIDAEINKISQEPAYKPVMDKKALYNAELAKLEADLLVLSNGIGSQLKYTGKAIPWLTDEYLNMMSIQE